MTKTLALAALMMLAGGVAATPAFAQDAPAPAPTTEADHSAFYAGAGINLYFIDKTDAAQGLPIRFEDQPSPGAFMGRVGFAFNQYVAIEAELGVGGAKSEFEVTGTANRGDISVKNPASAHAVFTAPLGAGGGYLLGKAGYTSVKVERTYNGASSPDIDINGASFGVGGGIRGDAWDFRGEYSFVSGDASTGVLGLTVMRRF